MSIPCPHCQSPLNPKGLKPGQFKPKCPKCGNVFVLIVPEDASGTIAVKMLPVGPQHDPSQTGDFTEPARDDPNSTGNFTETMSDPNATGAATPANAGEPTSLLADAPKPKKKGQAAEDAIPIKLGGYEVIKVLGKGGMGAVLLGRQVSLDRKVAIKIMHARLAKDPGFVARFVREAYAAAQLSHHNVVQVFDIGEERGTHFFSMEYVNGKSLMEVVKKDGKLDVEVAVGYILQAARGLRYGHAQGMVHRDIKPDNLMLNTEGIVKVADLGLVKVAGPDLPKARPALQRTTPARPVAPLWLPPADPPRSPVAGHWAPRHPGYWCALA